MRGPELCEAYSTEQFVHAQSGPRFRCERHHSETTVKRKSTVSTFVFNCGANAVAGSTTQSKFAEEQRGTVREIFPRCDLLSIE